MDFENFDQGVRFWMGNYRYKKCPKLENLARQCERARERGRHYAHVVWWGQSHTIRGTYPYEAFVG